MTTVTKKQNFFVRILNSLIEARQMQANAQLAQMLQREYPNESLPYIMDKIAEGKAEELRR